MTTRKLFLDDIRQPKDACYLVQDWAKLYFNDEWDVVKTHREFVSWVKRNGVPTHVSFDHDLGDFENGVELNGFSCAKFLVNYCIDTEQPLPKYMVHSANPVGSVNIISLFKNFEKHYNFS
jgi:hypothetical protein